MRMSEAEAFLELKKIGILPYSIQMTFKPDVNKIELGNVYFIFQVYISDRNTMQPTDIKYDLYKGDVLIPLEDELKPKSGLLLDGEGYWLKLREWRDDLIVWVYAMDNYEKTFNPKKG